MSEDNKETDDSEREDKPSRLAIAGSRSNSLAENLKKEDWRPRTGKKESAGSRSISMANYLENNKDNDQESSDTNERDSNSSNQT